jgi:HPt (histidine-containing phosphotransfer) domain-containing protein
MNDVSRREGNPARNGAVFDPAEASRALGLTLEEFAPLLAKAAGEIRIRLDAVRQGVAEEDLRAVALNSHTLKSVVATLRAEAVREAAIDMERCAKAGECARCAGMLACLEERAAELLAELDRA